jgi:hypothetical protein
MSSKDEDWNKLVQGKIQWRAYAYINIDLDTSPNGMA